MNIPNRVIDVIAGYPMAMKAELYFAVINYMQCGSVPEQLSSEGRKEFEEIRLMLDPILRRRRQQAEYRRRKKLEKQIQKQEPKKGQEQSNEKDIVPVPDRPLNRRERRALERKQRKKQLTRSALWRPDRWSQLSGPAESESAMRRTAR